jgi:hypothetical protein
MVWQSECWDSITAADTWYCCASNLKVEVYLDQNSEFHHQVGGIGGTKVEVRLMTMKASSGRLTIMAMCRCVEPGTPVDG